MVMYGRGSSGVWVQFCDVWVGVFSHAGDFALGRHVFCRYCLILGTGDGQVVGALDGEKLLVTLGLEERGSEGIIVGTGL